MKKILSLAIVMSLFASSAFALTITSAGTTLGGGTYKPSSGVTVVVFTNATGTEFAAGAANVKGKKEYATNNTDPKIYSQTAATAGTSTVTASTWAPSGSWVAQ